MDELNQLKLKHAMLKVTAKQLMEENDDLKRKNKNLYDSLHELATSTFHSAEDYKERASEALKGE